MATVASSLVDQVVAAAGGSFLLEDRVPNEVFTPEDLSEEQRQIADTAARFARERILPEVERIEAKETGLMRKLLGEAAELGFTAIDIPEDCGGLGLDKVTSALVADHSAAVASFSTAFGAHAGIGTLPLIWYGTPEQKQKYLPRLASAEIIGAYALSEATSGSDAMNIRTRATLSADGSEYILNGEKMWITNGGFADLYTVFAKIDGEKFSAFLVERGTPGFSTGNEEHKLGIRGSSTCPLIFSDCHIPVGNLLGEAGKGHHIAFNILNMGRFKLGAACLGGARQTIEHAISYAKERTAFGKPIAEFGLIQRKIAASATKLFVTESMAYRTAGMMDAALAKLDEEQAKSAGPVSSREIQKRIEEYAVECSILKVYGSEMLGYATDELVQIMGGYGYVEDYPAERLYRDARINRIFEGTNEINRLIITGWLMKRALNGQLPLLPAIKKLMDEVMQPPSFETEDLEAPLAREAKVLSHLRKMVLLAAGAASQRFMAALQEQQEVMSDLADGITAVFALESALLRARKMKAASKSGLVAAKMTAAFAEEALATVEQAARRVLAASAEGDTLQVQLGVLRRFARLAPVDGVTVQREIARHFLDAGRYRI